eukprot:5060426-Pleurochrysis_carterae.AAC.1
MSRPEGPCTTGALSEWLFSPPPTRLDRMALIAFGSGDPRTLARMPEYASSLTSSGRTSREGD